MCTIPLLSHVCRECYTPEADLYARLKRKGMGLVTVTDHDSIGAAESLRQHPDFFPSEEVTVHLESGNEAHVGVYDIEEWQHEELQARRDDMPRFLAFLREQDLLFSINHMFSSLTGRRNRADFEFFATHFPLMETRNGHMLERANRAATKACELLGRTAIGGSDSHGVWSLGRVWTEVPGARNKHEFFAGLRAGNSRTEGRSGGILHLSSELLTIAGSMFSDKTWTLGLAPLIALVPLIGAINATSEVAFERYWRDAWLKSLTRESSLAQDIRETEEMAA
jgi:predicted metal-dependent phosphoesterase TrpH